MLALVLKYRLSSEIELNVNASLKMTIDSLPALIMTKKLD